MLVYDRESAPCFCSAPHIDKLERWLMRLLITISYIVTYLVMLFLESNLQRNNGNVELKSNLTKEQLKVVEQRPIQCLPFACKTFFCSHPMRQNLDRRQRRVPHHQFNSIYAVFVCCLLSSSVTAFLYGSRKVIVLTFCTYEACFCSNVNQDAQFGKKDPWLHCLMHPFALELVAL